MIKVSIICPVHNAEKWISTSVESFINQTLKDIEILLIDDDSKDNTPIILNDYAKKDNRIKLFHRVHEPNEFWGQGRAVEIGRKVAQGEYIIFPDSDDFLELDALENLYIAAEHKADIVKGGHNIIDEDGNLIIEFPRPITAGFIHNWKDLSQENRKIFFCDFGPQLQSFLIRRKFQENIPFSHYCYADTSTVFKIKLLANNIKYIVNHVYTSIAHKTDYSNNIFDIIKLFDELELFLKQYNTNNEVWEYFSFLKINTLTTMIPQKAEQTEKFLEILHRDIQRENIKLLKQDSNWQSIYNTIMSSNYII